MSRLNKFLGKAQKVKIGDEEFDFHPLTMNDVDLLMDLGDEKKRGAAFKKILNITLKKAVPDATDEEIKGLSMKYFEELMNAIIKVSGLDEYSRESRELKEKSE